MANTEIFVSWSGPLSHKIGKEFTKWIPTVIPNAKPFISSENLNAGSQWMAKLFEKLGTCKFAVLCLTPDNIASPWMLFEAGAVAKGFDTARVVPLLVNLTTSDLKDPLRGLNAIEFTQDHFRKLVREVNDLSTDPEEWSTVQDRFDGLWQKLESRVRTILAEPAHARPRSSWDVFLSAPMAAYRTEKKYREQHAIVEQVFTTLVKDCKLQVYWAGEKIRSMKDFDTLDLSVDADLSALHSSTSFMLIYPERLTSSVLFEAGYALALDKGSHYFVRDRKDLPFLMRELPGRDRRVTIHAEEDWKDYEGLCRRLRQSSGSWFPRAPR